MATTPDMARRSSATDGRDAAHLGGGVVFAKLFPNPDEPYRGIFVADQVAATAERVTWSIVAPAPWVPRVVARVLGKPWVKGSTTYDGHPVSYPRYPVLPRRIGYATVAPLIAITAHGAFERARERVDARFVHVHDLYPSGAAGRRLCARAGLPYVLTVHGLDLYSNLANPRWRREATAAAVSASAIVCVSRALARDCIAELGVDPRRVTVVPNTYDASRFVYVERPGHDGPLRLVTLGRLSPEKGHDVLLTALARLVEGGADLTLTVIGDGRERAALEGLAARLGVAGRVRFTGRLLGDDVPREFATADAFVLPSRREGFGIALIEAMATGLPVVATRSGGPEGIVDPGDGLLVDPDDDIALTEAITALAEGISTYDGKRIAERVASRYSPAVVGARLAEVYADVIAGSPTVSGNVTGEGV